MRVINKQNKFKIVSSRYILSRNPSNNKSVFDHSITIAVIVFIFILFAALQLSAQETKKNNKDIVRGQKIKTPKINQNPTGDTISVKDDAGNVLMTVTDEGSAGSIKLNDAGNISTSTNKLYNNGGSLYWNGSALGSGAGVTTINDLTDARSLGNSIFFGSGAGINDDGSDNRNYAIGINAIGSTTTGISNAAIGYNTLFYNTTGNYNIGLGQGSLFYNNTGSGNVAVGYHSNHFNQAGSNNTILGHQAGRGSATHNKSGNVFIGYQAGYFETSDNKLYIENTSSSTPLIWGDFAADSVRINGNLDVAGKTKAYKLQIIKGASPGYVLKSDSYGNATWQVSSSGTGSDDDWTFSSIDIYSSQPGNVGIGTSTPLSKLSVKGNGLSKASIYGENADTNGIGIYGFASDSYYVHNYGGYFVANGIFGTGVYGEASSSGGYESQSDRYGGYFKASGVWGTGLYGYGQNNAIGVKGESSSRFGVYGISNSGVGVRGTSVSSYAGTFYSEQGTALNCQADGNNRNGMDVTTSGDNSMGLRVVVFGNNSIGVQAEANGPDGVAFKAWVNGLNATAGWFGGDVTITGVLSKGGGSFKIDHPLDPRNKYLYHSFVESPDMMNIYNGNIELDDNGEAIVILPDWFEALNMQFRYQLTAIGTPGPNLYVAEEISDNQFRIAGGKDGMKVSWQVTGIRHDAFANAKRIPVEEMKKDNELGKYLHPTVYNMPKSAGIGYDKKMEIGVYDSKQKEEEQKTNYNKIKQ